MVKLWATKVKYAINGTTINDVPERYLEAVKAELDEQGVPY